MTPAHWFTATTAVITGIYLFLRYLFALRGFQSQNVYSIEPKYYSITKWQPRHALPPGFYCCNPSVTELPGQTDLLVAYRETNVHFASPSVIWHALCNNLTTSVGLLRVDKQTLQVKQSFQLDFTLPSENKKRCIVRGLHDPRIHFDPASGKCSLLAYHVVKRSSGQHRHKADRPYYAKMHYVVLPSKVIHDTDVTLAAIRPSAVIPLEHRRYEGLPQKNWNMFSYSSNSEVNGSTSEQFVVTRVAPHQICKVWLEKGQVVTMYETMHPTFAELLHDNPTWKIHGGTALIPWQRNGTSELIAACHIKKPGLLHGDYQTILYTCQATPPFAIQQVSRPFVVHDPDPTTRKKQSAPSIQLTSGLFVTADAVHLTMGIMDREMWCVSIPKEVVEVLLEKSL